MSDPITRLNAALEGRYRIERQLGEGGMATVYLADDLRHERKVALKVLKPELAAVVGAERFLAEIKTTANLQHPHILPLFDSGEADSFLFYVMPYVEGESLRERLDREHQLSVDDALDLTKKVADALDYAHENGVVHRDIKPGNILLSARGEPLVGDFGIALAVAQAGGGRITETGLSLGTPHYMSPEQATGDRDVDPRSDVYALACVLYEMLAGEPPFSASTAQAILAKILTMDAPSITMVRRTVPPNVGNALARALEKLPADRFSTAAEFAAALTDRGFTYETRERTTRGLAEAQRASVSAYGDVDRRAFWAIAGVALVAAGLAGWGWLRETPAARQRDPMRFTIPSLESSALIFGGNRRDVAISPDVSLIVYVGLDEAGTGPQLNLRPLADLSGAPLRGGEGGTGPVVSPDGEWVAFVHYQSLSTLRRVSTLGGAPVTLTDVPTEIIGVAWGSDDQIVIGTRQGGLFRVSAGGGEPEVLTTPAEGELEHLWPTFVEGGRAVVFVINPVGGAPLNAGELAVVDLESQEVTRLGVTGVSPRYVPTGHLVYAAEDGSVRAVRFDARSLTVTGTTVPLVEGVSVKASGAADFSVSDDGDLVYVLGAGVSAAQARSLVWVDREGREEPIQAQANPYFYPRISPEGRRLALDAREAAAGGDESGIWIWDFTGETLTRMVLGDDPYMYPVWSPDGRRVAYSSQTGRDLYWKAANNTGTPEVLVEGAGGEGSQQPEAYFFTPDGTAVVYREQANADTDDDLVMRSLSDSQEVWRLNGDFNERNAELSPDGHWMAYQSDESGPFEVYVRPFPDVDADQVQISNNVGFYPLWSRDGRELFYLQPGTRWQLMSVPVEPIEAGGRFAFGPREVVMDWPYYTGGEGRNYDVSPDGQRFVGIKAENPGGEAGAAPPEITVVLNWVEELRERMGEN